MAAESGDPSHCAQEQASWVCRCEDRVVQRLEQDFKVTLQQQNSLEQWAAWLDGVVSQVLKPYQGSTGFPKAAKLFLLKWSFYRCAPAGRGQRGVRWSFMKADVLVRGAGQGS